MPSGAILDAMEVDKTQFDELLGKLLKAKPLPKAAIPKKARRKAADLPKPARQESQDR
jgi:hypothetical protein